MTAVTLAELNDDPTDIATLLDRNGPEDGVIALLARPTSRTGRTTDLTEDLLACFGVRDDVNGVGRDAHADWSRLLVWAATWQVADVIVADAHRLDEANTHALVAFATSIRARLWLVHPHSAAERLDDLTARWPTRRVDERHLRGRWMTEPDPATGDTDSASPQPEPFPRVPAADVSTFRARARQLLDADQFTVVDQRFTSALDCALELFSQQVDEETLAAALRERIADCATIDEMLTDLRATQAAALRHGWLLRVHLPSVLGHLTDAPTRARRSPTLWRRLAAYRQPQRPAVCALAAAGIDPDTMRSLRVIDVNEQGTAVIVDGATVAIEDGAHHFLAAARNERLAHGAADEQPLLVNMQGGHIAERTIAAIINHAEQDTGIAVSTGIVRRRDSQHGKWAERHGLSLIPLPAAAASGADR